MKVLNRLQTIKIGPKLWKLTNGLMFWHKGQIYTVEEGFITDGASNIRLLWSLCPPMSGLTAEYAVLHDLLYSKSSPWKKMTRKRADQLFLMGMKDAGVSKVRRDAIYLGVRAGGSKSFKACYDWEKNVSPNCY